MAEAYWLYGEVKMIRVLLADDQEVLRESVGYILDNDDEIKVIGLVDNGIKTMEMCEKMKPNIVLMDIEMPSLNGVSATKMIKEKYEGIKVIILTTFDNRENVIESFAAGADGYILKSIEYEKMIDAIKCVQSGFIVIDSKVKHTITDLINKSQTYLKSK